MRIMRGHMLRTVNFYEMKQLLEYSRILELFRKDKYKSMIASFTILERNSIHKKVIHLFLSLFYYKENKSI